MIKKFLKILVAFPLFIVVGILTAFIYTEFLHSQLIWVLSMLGLSASDHWLLQILLSERAGAYGFLGMFWYSSTYFWHYYRNRPKKSKSDRKKFSMPGLSSRKSSSPGDSLGSTLDRDE